MNLLQSLGRFLGEKLAQVYGMLKLHVDDRGIHCTSAEIRGEITAGDIPGEIARVEVVNAALAGKVDKVAGRELMPSPGSVPSVQRFLNETGTYMEVADGCVVIDAQMTSDTAFTVDEALLNEYSQRCITDGKAGTEAFFRFTTEEGDVYYKVVAKKQERGVHCLKAVVALQPGEQKGGIREYSCLFSIDQNTDRAVFISGTVAGFPFYVSGYMDTLLEGKADAGDLAEHVDNLGNPHRVDKSQVGLSEVNNTSDADKPVSTAMQAALTAHNESGEAHSDLRSRVAQMELGLSGIEPGAEVNVQADWNEIDSGSDSFIMNKPEVYTKPEVDVFLGRKVDKAEGCRLINEAEQAVVGALSVSGKGALTAAGTPSSMWQLSKADNGPKVVASGSGISLKNADDTYSNLTVKDLTVNGNVAVEGESFVVNAQTVEVVDNTILLNKGEVGAGVTKGVAGLEIDRGSQPKYNIYFDESDDRFKAGATGDLWPIMLRDKESELVGGDVLVWDAATKRAKSGGSLDAELGKYALKTDIPIALKSPNALTFTGSALGVYDGSSALTVNIPAGLSLGETSATAYRGDRGKVAYDYSQGKRSKGDLDVALQGEINNKLGNTGKQIITATDEVLSLNTTSDIVSLMFLKKNIRKGYIGLPTVNDDIYIVADNGNIGLYPYNGKATYNGNEIVTTNDARLSNARPANGGNADTVDGLHANRFARASLGISFDGTSGDITTEEFLTMLNGYGAFDQPCWSSRGTWSYASNKIISDTGTGRIYLAGASVEVISDSMIRVTIRITTASATPGAEPKRVFVYTKNETTTAWIKLANSTDIPTSLPANGGNADTLDGYHAAALIPNVFNQSTAPTSGMKKGDIWVKP